MYRYTSSQQRSSHSNSGVLFVRLNEMKFLDEYFFRHCYLIDIYQWDKNWLQLLNLTRFGCPTLNWAYNVTRGLKREHFENTHLNDSQLFKNRSVFFVIC